MTKTLHNPIMYLKSHQTGGEKERKKIKESAKIIEKLFDDKDDETK